MKRTKQNNLYVAPQAECIELHTEQCIAASTIDSGNLGIMDDNDILNELGTSSMSMGF